MHISQILNDRPYKIYDVSKTISSNLGLFDILMLHSFIHKLKLNLGLKALFNIIDPIISSALQFQY